MGLPAYVLVSGVLTTTGADTRILVPDSVLLTTTDDGTSDARKGWMHTG